MATTSVSHIFYGLNQRLLYKDIIPGAPTTIAFENLSCLPFSKWSTAHTFDVAVYEFIQTSDGTGEYKPFTGILDATHRQHYVQVHSGHDDTPVRLTLNMNNKDNSSWRDISICVTLRAASSAEPIKLAFEWMGVNRLDLTTQMGEPDSRHMKPHDEVRPYVMSDLTHSVASPPTQDPLVFTMCWPRGLECATLYGDLYRLKKVRVEICGNPLLEHVMVKPTALLNIAHSYPMSRVPYAQCYIVLYFNGNPADLPVIHLSGFVAVYDKKESH